MEPATIRLPDDTYQELKAEADERDASMSEVVREKVEKGMEYDDLKARHDDLQRQLAAVNRRQQEHTELVEYVEEQRELERERERRADAPVWRRAKYWIFGRDRDDE